MSTHLDAERRRQRAVPGVAPAAAAMGGCRACAAPELRRLQVAGRRAVLQVTRRKRQQVPQLTHRGDGLPLPSSIGVDDPGVSTQCRGGGPMVSAQSDPVCSSGPLRDG